MKLKDLKEGQLFEYKGQKYVVDHIFYVDDDSIGVFNIETHRPYILNGYTEVIDFKTN